MDIGKHIAALLYEYDCVIIPQVGGFIASRKASTIDRNTHQVQPPSRRIAFNQNLNTNDGLLAGHIAQHEQITYSEALQKIYSYTDTIQQQLESGQTFELGEVGHFRFNEEQKIVFTPSTTNNFFLEAFGLSTIQATPTIKSKPVEATVSTAPTPKPILNLPKVDTTPVAPAVVPTQPKEEVKKPTKKIYKLQWRPVAVAASVLIGLSLIAVLLIQQPEGINYSALNVFKWLAEDDSTLEHANPVEAEAPMTSTTTIAVNSDEDDVSATEEETTGSIPVSKNIPTEAEADSVFYIIGGAFSEEDNARDYLHYLIEEGFRPEIVGTNKRGLLRISILKKFSLDEAEQELTQIHLLENKHAWILALKND